MSDILGTALLAGTFGAVGAVAIWRALGRFSRPHPPSMPFAAVLELNSAEVAQLLRGERVEVTPYLTLTFEDEPRHYKMIRTSLDWREATLTGRRSP